MRSTTSYAPTPAKELPTAVLLDALCPSEEHSTEEWSAVVSSCVPLAYRRGQTMIWEGERPSRALLITKGQARVLIVGPNGREVQIYRIEYGEVCAANLISVRNSSLSLVHIVAETDVKAVGIDAPNFRQLMRTNGLFHDFIMAKINSGMASILSVMKNLAFVRVEQRIAELLLHRSAPCEEGRIVRMTHASIATELGTAREVVSRILKQLERDGIIRVKRGSIIIKSLCALNNAVAPTASPA